MFQKYPQIRPTEFFVEGYTDLRFKLKKSSPMAYRALPHGINNILAVIDSHPHGWPVKRKNIGGFDLEFHLAIVNISYRKLHVRYIVEEKDMCSLLAIWIDGQDEPNYTI